MERDRARRHPRRAQATENRTANVSFREELPDRCRVVMFDDRARREAQLPSDRFEVSA